MSKKSKKSVQQEAVQQEAVQQEAVQQEAVQPEPAPKGAKAALRALFSEVGARAAVAAVFACGSEVAVRTAISDLKNPKYARGDVLFLRKEKEEYVRVAPPAPLAAA